MSQNKYQQKGARDLKCGEVKRDQHPVPTPGLGQGESPFGAELAKTEKTESAAVGPTEAARDGRARGRRAGGGRGGDNDGGSDGNRAGGEAL